MTSARNFNSNLRINRVLTLAVSMTAWLLAVPHLSAQLVINNLSVHATMPDSSGQQQVTTSFQLANNGTTTVPASTTTVQSAGITTSLATPRLQPGASAFFGTTVATTLNSFPVIVTAANNTTALFQFATGQTGRWQPIGPSVLMYKGLPKGVGRTTTIAIDGSTTGTVYAGARGSGLWKTTDAGAHWEPLTDALPSVNIYAVAVDSANTQHVVIDTPAGVFSSANGGHVWTLLYNKSDLLGRGSDGGQFIVRSFRPVICCAAAAAANGPSTGTSAALPAPNLSIFPFNLVFAYLTTNTGLMVSIDGGMNWSQAVGGGIATSLDQDFSNPAHMLLGISGGSSGSAIFETFLGGLLPIFWHQLQGCPGAQVPSIPGGAGVWATQSGGTEWISFKSGAQHEIWRTTGQTCFVSGFPEHGWQQILTGNPCGGDTSTWSFLRADPRNSQVLYKAGVELCRSTDGGASFQVVNGPHSDQHAIAFHPLFPNLLYEGNDGGFYQSTDGGQSFNFDAVGLSVTEFLDTDVGGASPNVVLGASQDNAISATDLSSPAWHMADFNGDGTGVVVDPLDSTVQYTVAQDIDGLSIINNAVPASFDSTGLPSGCQAYDESPFLYSQFIATSNPSWHLVIASGNNGPATCGGLFSGPPWVPLFAPSDERLVRITYDAGIGLFLAGGNLGSVYINFSPDVMAKVWQSPDFSFVTSIVPDPNAAANYFVSLVSGHIVEIHSVGPLQFGGTDITANLPPVVVMTLVANPNEPGVLYAGTQGQGIFRGVRDATGQWSWQAFSNGMPVGAVITKLRYDSNSGVIYASSYGRGEFALSTITIF